MGALPGAQGREAAGGPGCGRGLPGETCTALPSGSSSSARQTLPSHHGSAGDRHSRETAEGALGMEVPRRSVCCPPQCHPL